MKLKQINTILTWLTFLMPLIIYSFTMAPTVSLWDCGEFIATSVILGVPHPPGTPLYLIISNFFSQLPLFNNLAARVNLVSPITSALAVMFLYMIIIYLLEEFNKKILPEVISYNRSLMIYMASFIGAMTFAVTDSHWFNAVEAEVYSLSTFFTATVIWLILKWSRDFEKKDQLKYLILISYLIGLAIGIHLLNLLAIPFIGLIIYFKFIKSIKSINFQNLTYLIISTGLSFLIIYKGIIKGLPSILNKTNNPFILYMFFAVVLIAAIITNIPWKNKKFSHLTMIIFSLSVLFITANELLVEDYGKKIKDQKSYMQEYSYYLLNTQESLIQNIENSNTQEAAMYNKMNLINSGIKLEISEWAMENQNENIRQYTNTHNKGLSYISLLKKQSIFSISILFILLLSSVILLHYTYTKNPQGYNKLSRLVINCVLMILLGYSSYVLIFIRAQQNPQINYNNPNTIKSAYEYINRDQYGQWDITDRRASLINNSQQNRQSFLRYTKAVDNKIVDGRIVAQTIKENEVTDKEVSNFVWQYQFKEMYLRYFAWQFIGKETWNNRSWERNSITNQPLASMPPLQGVNWFRYGLPLAFLLGLIGLWYHTKNDILRSYAVFTLFILTGIAIVVYLNQSDPQPRERDYAYVGSFFAFSIWIGIGAFASMKFFQKKFKSILIPGSILFILVPMNMFINNYYEHDRSNRYEAWDYAYNLLNSCEPNGILFTNGDNDTFPLWYLQYVEKIRPDIKLINLSLLNFPSYIRQLDEHTPSLNMFDVKKANGVWDIGEKFIDSDNNEMYDEAEGFIDKNENGIWDLGEKYYDRNGNKQYDKAEKFYDEKNRNEYLTAVESESNVDEYLKQNQLDRNMFLDLIESLKINEVVELSISKWFNEGYPNVQLKAENGAVFDWEFYGGTYGLGLTNIAILNIIEHCYGNRPIYFSVTTGDNNLGLDDYLVQEGLVYKLTGEKYNGNMDMHLNLPKTLKMMKRANEERIIKTKEDYIEHQNLLLDNPNLGTYQYRNLNKNHVYYGPHITRVSGVYRNLFHTVSLHLANEISSKSNIEDSFDITQLAKNYFPENVLPEITPDFGLYREGEYYNNILRIIAYMKQADIDIPTEFIADNMPELFEYIMQNYPQLIN